MNNMEKVSDESSPEKIDFDLKAQESILAFEALCLKLESAPDVNNQEFLDILTSLQENLQAIASAHSDPDSSVWYNYYLTQTYGILSQSFPDFEVDFDSSYDELLYSVQNLQDEQLSQKWQSKITEMIG